ncbi:MAG TPA: hypothetical protein VLT36_10405 [Candidatus Dormibacteraeota bacterium]|nr:hypothetical protein [Candidatus Dormibacteraeota bacterium]
MTETAIAGMPAPSLEEMQKGWVDLLEKIGQLQAEYTALEQDNKSLRALLERVIDHRSKSHNELVLIISGLVSRLPINDVGPIVARLVEHNNNLSQYLSALSKGTAEALMEQPEILKTLEHAKRDITGAVKPLVEELTRLGAPFEEGVLNGLCQDPEQFFTPRVVRANRCFVKGYLPRERVVRDFGEDALVFFNDVTTDPKLNPNPKKEEIALGFKSDFETLFQQHPGVAASKRDELMRVYRQVQKSKAPCDEARQQRNAFLRLSFLLDLLHYYDNQNTEAPDTVFAQRLPSLVEQLVLAGPPDALDEKLIAQAETLMGYVVSPEHRQMIINNIGKGGGIAKTLKFVLRLRAEKVLASDPDNIIADFARHLIGGTKAPQPDSLVPTLRLLPADMQLLVIHGLIDCDRLRKSEAEALGRAVAEKLGIKLPEKLKAEPVLPPEIERQQAWARIKDLIGRRTEAVSVAAAIRERLNAKYDAEEIRQSWLTLIEADSMSLIRIFCQIPYLASGKTDPIARTVIETYVTRLTHEKYAGTYQKVVNSLRNMFQAKPDSPTLLNFLALVRWVDPAGADKLSADIGMPVAVGA